MKHSFRELKEFLEEKHDLYNRHDFIEHDPVSVPHSFSKKEDIEIAGFLSASIAWGQRPVILRNARKLIQLMDNAPFDFVMTANESDLNRFDRFAHRTFNGEDATFFIRSLQNIYRQHGGLETVFAGKGSVKTAISDFRNLFFSIPHSGRTGKHVADPMKRSAAKRINMFLRWMVRNDKKGVDFGLWTKVKPSQLFCPLDVHSGNVSRLLGLLNRKQNDWQAVEELTQSLRKFDPADPVKYDFALFGLGVSEKF